MTIFRYKIIILQGGFSIVSALSIESSKLSWHLYCNYQAVSVVRCQDRPNLFDCCLIVVLTARLMLSAEIVERARL